MDFGATLVAHKQILRPWAVADTSKPVHELPYLAHMYASYRKPMPGALVKLRPGHQR